MCSAANARSSAEVTSTGSETQYTLCDGWPRIDGSTTVLRRFYRKDETTIPVSTSTTQVFLPLEVPDCTVPKLGCVILQSSWTSVVAEWDPTLSTYGSFLNTVTANSRSFDRTHWSVLDGPSGQNAPIATLWRSQGLPPLYQSQSAQHYASLATQLYNSFIGRPRKSHMTHAKPMRQ